MSEEKKAPVKKAAVKKKSAVKSKQTADKGRRDDAVAEGQANIPEPTEEQIAEQQRRENIQSSMLANQETIESLEDQADQLREQNAKLLLTLYPQQGPNDPHHVAVKGFLAASRADRATRATNPAKLAELIKNMHKSPLDAAMTRHTKRGTRRQVRQTKT